MNFDSPGLKRLFGVFFVYYSMLFVWRCLVREREREKEVKKNALLTPVRCYFPQLVTVAALLKLLTPLWFEQRACTRPGFSILQFKRRLQLKNETVSKMRKSQQEHTRRVITRECVWPTFGFFRIGQDSLSLSLRPHLSIGASSSALYRPVLVFILCSTQLSQLLSCTL